MTLDVLLKMPVRKALRTLWKDQEFVLRGQEYLSHAEGYVPDGKNEGRKMSAWLDIVNAYASCAKIVHVIAERHGRSRARLWSVWDSVKNEYNALCAEWASSPK